MFRSYCFILLIFSGLAVADNQDSPELRIKEYSQLCMMLLDNASMLDQETLDRNKLCRQTADLLVAADSKHAGSVKDILQQAINACVAEGSDAESCDEDVDIDKTIVRSAITYALCGNERVSITIDEQLYLAVNEKVYVNGDVVADCHKGRLEQYFPYIDIPGFDLEFDNEEESILYHYLLEHIQQNKVLLFDRYLAKLDLGDVNNRRYLYTLLSYAIDSENHHFFDALLAKAKPINKTNQELLYSLLNQSIEKEEGYFFTKLLAQLDSVNNPPNFYRHALAVSIENNKPERALQIIYRGADTVGAAQLSF